jgi:hypothetical protein
MELKPKPAVEVEVSRRRKIVKIDLCCMAECEWDGEIRYKGHWFCPEHLPGAEHARIERAERRRLEHSHKLHLQAVATLTDIANMSPVSGPVLYARLRLRGMGLPGPDPEPAESA